MTSEPFLLCVRDKMINVGFWYRFFYWYRSWESGDYQLSYRLKNICRLERRTFFLPTAMTGEGKHYSYFSYWSQWNIVTVFFMDHIFASSWQTFPWNVTLTLCFALFFSERDLSSSAERVQNPESGSSSSFLPELINCQLGDKFLRQGLQTPHSMPALVHTCKRQRHLLCRDDDKK